jgi:hypothetical protein
MTPSFLTARNGVEADAERAGGGAELDQVVGSACDSLCIS